MSPCPSLLYRFKEAQSSLGSETFLFFMFSVPSPVTVIRESGVSSIWSNYISKHMSAHTVTREATADLPKY